MADWDVHHALVAAVRRLVRLSGGVQEAKEMIDAIAAADALDEEKEEGKEPAPIKKSSYHETKVRAF